jgi:hypothetical protein
LVSSHTAVVVHYRATHHGPGFLGTRALVTSVVAGSVTHPCPGPSTPACLATMERHTHWHLFLNERLSGSPLATPATARCSSPLRCVHTPGLHRVALARLAPRRSALHRRCSLCHARPSRCSILSAGGHVTVVTESHRRQAPCRAAIFFWTFRRTPWQRPLSLAPRRCHTPGYMPAGSHETQRIPRINRFLCGVQGVKPDLCK